MYRFVFKHCLRFLRNFSKCNDQTLFKASTGTLFGKLFRPRNVLFIPVMQLSILHEKDKGSIFKKSDVPVKELIKEADELYNEKNWDDLMTLLLKHKDSDNGEMLWRLTRILFEKAQKTEEDRLRKGLMMKAVDISQKAVDIDPNNYLCHKWHAIVLEHLGEFQGTEERHSQAFEIKKHLTRAIELNENDPVLFHTMGLWCYEYAEISWFERSFSSVISTNYPHSSYEEALAHFMKAEKMHYGLSSANYLMIAKTHLKLKNKEKAKKYLLKTLNFSFKNPDDKNIFEEAVGLMKAHKLDEN